MSAPTLSTAAVVEIRAALGAGASPAAALSTMRSGPLAPAAAAARVGRSLVEVAAEVETADAHADLLLRALAVAERTGAGGADAVDQVLAAIAAERQLERVLQARTAQARMSALVLTVLPAVLWVLLVGLDPAALRFYGTAAGLLSAAIAVTLGVAGWCWSRRIVARGARAAAGADPLATPRPRPDVPRALAVALAVLIGTAWAAGLLAGLALAGAAAWAASRRRAAPVRGTGGDAAGEGAGGGGGAPGGGAAEAVELLAAAMAAGLDAATALVTVEPLAPPAARPPLRHAAARLRAGWDPGEAFAGTGLAEVGAVLAATARWGAPAHAALRRLAEDIRGARRAAAEVAAERAQVALIFPTTLLTLPAFLVALVPPLVWSAFAG